MLTNARFACKACEVITVQLGKFSHKLLSLHVLRRDDFSREEGENLEDETFHRQSFVRGGLACSMTGRDGVLRNLVSYFSNLTRFFSGSRNDFRAPFANCAKVVPRRNESRKLSAAYGVHFHFRTAVLK